MGQPRRHTARAVRAAAVVAAVVITTVTALAAGCSTGTPPDEDRTPDPESAALRVQTVSGADRLDERTRTQIEGEVGDVLSDYVVEAFLGDYPREDFVRAFGSFTAEAARKATRKIDRLTAATAADATDVRATRLDARLSFLTRAATVYAGTAVVDFAFEATMQDGSTRELALTGRILLDAGDGTWRIFGYDVTLDNGTTVDGETEPDTQSDTQPDTQPDDEDAS